MARRGLTALFVATSLALVPAAASAQGSATPSLPACALGELAPPLRAKLPRELAKAERRFAASVRGRDRDRAGRAFAAAAAAYMYGLPPVAIRQTVQRFPRNSLLGIARLATPESRTVVAPNHDTLYSVSQLDLSTGPLVVDAPATRGRYSVLQLLDAFSNAFAYVGSGAERRRNATVVLVPPGWQGELPAGVRVVRSPTKLVWLIGRTLAEDDADIVDAGRLMGAYALTPLADWIAGRRNLATVIGSLPATRATVELPTGMRFFDALGAALAADPAPTRDRCALRAFARAGIGPGLRRSANAGALERRALSAGAAAGDRLIDVAAETLRRISARRYNGWGVSAPHTGRFGTDYSYRAVIAKVALAANTTREALYPTTDADSRGRPLNGRHDYVIRFRAGELPPVRAFWSLTLYNRNLFLNANPLDRYAVGDRTGGLRYGPGRSLRIYVQHEPPRGVRRANWLPAPSGRFVLYLRLYEPKPAAARGAWKPPTVSRVR
jgi:hypothetical protein